MQMKIRMLEYSAQFRINGQSHKMRIAASHNSGDVFGFFPGFFFFQFFHLKTEWKTTNERAKNVVANDDYDDDDDGMNELKKNKIDISSFT